MAIDKFTLLNNNLSAENLKEIEKSPPKNDRGQFIINGIPMRKIVTRWINAYEPI